MQQRRSKFAIIVIILAVLLYVANLVIDNPYTHSLVNFYLNEKFLSKLPIAAEYQSMRIQLFPPAIHLFGVRITNKTSVQSSDLREEELLSTSQVSLVISPWSLFLAKPQIGDLELHDLTAFWPPPENVLNALKELEPVDKSPKTQAQWPPKPSPPFSSMSIHNASLRMTFKGLAINAAQDPKEETTISTDGAEFHVDFHGWRDITLESSIQRLSVADRGNSYIEDAQLELNGSLRGDTFRSRKMKITSSRLTTEGDLKAEIDTSNDRTIQAINLETTQNTDVDFSVLGSFIDVGTTFGSVSGHTKTSIAIPVASKSPFSLMVEGLGQSHGAVLGGFHLYDSEADLQIDLDGINFKEVRIKSGSRSFGKGKGKLQFNSDLDYSFQAAPDKLPFDMLLGVFNVPFDLLGFELTSKNLTIAGKGDPFNMSVTADGRLENFATPTLPYSHDAFPKPPTCEIHFDLKIDTKKLSYGGTQGSCAGPNQVQFPLIVSGVTTFDELQGMDLSLSSPNDFDLSVLTYFAQAELAGSGKMLTRIHGPYNKIAVDSTLNVKGASIAAIPLDSINVETRVADGKISWKNLHITTSNNGLISSGDGSISFDKDLTLNAEVSAAELQPEIARKAIAAIARDEKSSLEFVTKQLKAKVKGPLLKPALYQGKVDLDLRFIRDANNEYASALSSQILSNDKKITTNQAHYVLGTLNANVNAAIERSQIPSESFLGGIGLNAEDSVTLDINAEKLDSSQDQIQHLPFVNPLAKEYSIKGTLSGQAKLSGNLKKISGLAKLNVDHVEILAIRAPSITSSVVIDGAKLDVIAEQGGNALKARMSIDLGDPAFPYKWYLTCRNFDARPLIPSAFSADPRSFAYFTGTWSMSGTFSKWWQSVGELELKGARIKYYAQKETGNAPFEVMSQKPVTVDMTPKGWSFRKNEKFVLASSYGVLELGMNQSKPPESIGIDLNGSLKLESLKSIFSTLEVATGQIQLKGGIYGSVDNPEVDLTVSDTKVTSESASYWQPVSFGFTEYRPALKDIQLKAKIGSRGIQLESFNAAKGNGTIKAEGFYSFGRNENEATDLAISLNDASFLYPFPIVKNFDTIMDGTIHISGTKAPLVASGNVRIKRARSNRDIDIREAILASIRSSTSRAGPQTLQPSVVFDLSVNAEESIGFNSRSIQATLSTNLHLAGSDVAPELLGLIEIKKGKFFYKRDFVINRGLINFDDPIKPDPALDISALAEAGGYKIVISITGRASEYAIDFTVDPPNRPDGTAISKVDIITLLNRGSLPDRQITGNGTGEGVDEKTAAAEALNLLAGQVEDTVQKVFDLSGQNIIRQVYIDTYADSDGTPIARFNLPLNITDDLDLILKVDQSTVKLSSEYSLHDSITLTGGIESSNNDANSGAKRQGTPADTGVDIKFRFAFP